MDSDFEILAEIEVEVVHGQVPFAGPFPSEVVTDEIDLSFMKDPNDPKNELDMNHNSPFIMDEQFEIAANVEISETSSENSDIVIEIEDSESLSGEEKSNPVDVSTETESLQLFTPIPDLSFPELVKEAKVMILSDGKWNEINHQGRLVPYYDQKYFQSVMNASDPNPQQSNFAPRQV